MLDVLDILVVVAILINAYLAVLQRIFNSANISARTSVPTMMQLQLQPCNCCLWIACFIDLRGERFCRAYCFRPCRAKPDMTISAE